LAKALLFIIIYNSYRKQWLLCYRIHRILSETFSISYRHVIQNRHPISAKSVLLKE